MPSDISPEALTTDDFRQILETAPDAMVVVGADGTVVFANRQTELLFGYPRAELMGRGLELLIPERARGTHGRHVARVFAAPSVRPMGSAIELSGRRADGTEVPIEVSLSPVKTSGGTLVSAAIRDVTERRRVEALARVSNERLVSAVESVQDAFALFDADDKLVLCNSTYRRLVAEHFRGPLIGSRREDIVRGFLDALALDGDAEREAYLAARRADKAGAASTFDVHLRDGRWLRVTNRRTPEGGVVQVTWDLTDELRRQGELREARAAAEAASEAKSEFLSSMSHELRTPLNAILGFAQLLQRDRKEPLSERHKERVGQILKGGEHLLRLIDDVLDLARIEAGRVSISTEPVGVAAVLSEVQQTLEPMASRAGVRVVLDPPPEGLPMISADRTRFSQILMNFGSNAIKYNRPGGTVTFAASRPEGSGVRVTVTDTGQGIAADKQAKLFQPFQRAGQETGPIEGTGIGLVITRRLAAMMQGSVDFRSAPGEGSAFWVDMPAVADEPGPIALPGAHRAGESPLDSERARLVLYVEDNPANVTFMRDFLGSFEGIELVTATTAEEGLVLARERVPAVVLMDINLPGMSGLDALEALRGYPETKDVPVIALTAAASPRDRQRGEQAGFFRYLAKPISVDDLEAALEALFAPRAS